MQRIIICTVALYGITLPHILFKIAFNFITETPNYAKEQVGTHDTPDHQ